MQREFRRAADEPRLDAGTRTVLQAPDRELTVPLPVVIDAGTARVMIEIVQAVD